MTELNEIEATEEVDRKNLAVVYRVEKLEPIPNKDRIEVVHLTDCGYTCVCEKRHQVGDRVVFVKYDSMLPKNDLFEFMRETKFRVKQKAFTERDDEDFIVGKVYSQGVVLPLQEVVDYMNAAGGYEDTIYRDDIEFGVDLTDDLGITKYIPPPQKGSGNLGNMITKGDFPTAIVSKTDEVNLASKVRALEELQGKRVYITQKLEGSSLTAFWDNDENELNVCSRNNQIGEHTTNKFWMAVNNHDLKTKMIDFDDITIQAELIGQGVQKNKLGIDGVDLGVFNVATKHSRDRFSLTDMEIICEKLGVPMVPLVTVIENFNMTFDELQELADKQVYANGEVAEGIVIRPCEPFFSRALRQVWSVKVINRDYRL